ncbi:hypothetical protein WDU94_003652 [Cyamophila willieti]
MPRKPSVPFESILDILLNSKESFSDFDKIPGCTNDLWKVLCAYISPVYCSTPFTIYSWFKTNRYGLGDLFFNTHTASDSDNKPDFRKNDSDSTHDSDTDTSNSSHTSSTEDGVEKLNIIASIDEKEWKDLSPKWTLHKDKRLGNRRRLILPQKAWTTIISRKFYEQTKLACCLTFTQSFVRSSTNTLFLASFTGSCKFCKAKLKGEVFRKTECDIIPTEATVAIHYVGLFDIEHPPLKRPLAGPFRKEIVAKLMSSSSQLYKSRWLTPKWRVAKSESLSKQRLDKDPIQSLYKFKYAGKSQYAIQDMGLDRFFVHYFSSVQIKVYNQYIKTSGNYSQIAIDATGGVVKKFRRPNGEKSHTILLYDISMHDRQRNKIISIGDMISERHDTASIAHFLQQWKKYGALTPKTIVTDMSPALMAACVQTFSQFSTLKGYLDNCANILSNPDMFVKPDFYLKNDIAHVVKLFTRFGSLKNVLKRTKEFYLRSLCLVLQEKHLESAAEILEHIFTVALYETEGNHLTDGSPIKSELSKKYLQHRISTTMHPTTLCEPEIDTQGEEISEDELLKFEKENFGGFKEFVDSIRKKVQIEMRDDGDRNNQQFLPGLVTNVLKISHLLPTFTAIMSPYFGYGNATSTSCAVESQFSILKNHAFKHGQLPARVDDFVAQHMGFISGSLKIDHFHDNLTSVQRDKNIAKPKKVKKPDTDTVTHNDVTNSQTESHRTGNTELEEILDINLPEKTPTRLDWSIDPNVSTKRSHETCENQEDNELDYVENWMGVNTVNEGPLRKRPRSSYLEPNSELEYLDLSHCLRTKSIGLIKNGNSFLLKPIQINQKSIVLKNTCGFDSVLQIFCTAACDSEAYNNYSNSRKSQDQFYELVIDMISKGVTANTYKKRAELLDKLFDVTQIFNNLFIINTVTTMDQLVNKLFKNHDNPPKFELYTEEVTVEAIYKCLETTDDKINQRKHLIIETYATAMNKLSEIPKSLKIDNQVFSLRGVVAFQGAYSTAVGHFVGYALRPNNQFEVYDDLNNKAMSISGNKEVNLQLLLYTT